MILDSHSNLWCSMLVPAPCVHSARTSGHVGFSLPGGGGGVNRAPQNWGGGGGLGKGLN